MNEPVQHVARDAHLSGVELTEAKLAKMLDALHATVDPMGRRAALRLPVQGYVEIEPVEPAAESTRRRVGVYDISHTGVAIIDQEPMRSGRQFNMLIPRERHRPIELLCSVRHCRAEGEGYVIGAQFGISWLDAVSAAVIPPRP